MPNLTGKITELGTIQHDAIPVPAAKTVAERKRVSRHKQQLNKPFIVWDGEGTTSTPGSPQFYSLFGAYNGAKHEYVEAQRLSTRQCIELIFKVDDDNPDAIHVSFAFGYDVSMILRNLTKDKFLQLRKKGYTYYQRTRIEHVPGKWFLVRRKVDGIQQTVKIFDVWGFFQSSFLAAVKTNISDHPVMKQLDIVEKGKAGRSTFSYEDMPKILEYWKIEAILAHALVNRLRQHLYDVDLKITSWHGPGALASYAYRQHKIASHKEYFGDRLYELFRYGYAGGRFERFHIGRYSSGTSNNNGIYGYDINSAYPWAISHLPTLHGGYWRYVREPTEVKTYGIYHIRLDANLRRPIAAPFFYRDNRARVSFPWHVEGWYWSPEVAQAIALNLTVQQFSIIEGWEFIPASDVKPFDFVNDVYTERKEMKAAGIGAQMALKLLLNSLYGKQAQRAGWERTGTAPKWHQLDWAGWVTSHTRATLFQLMQRMDYDQLIAVETDGLYTTASPDQLNVVDSKELGGWEVSEYLEMVYLQSGVYAKQTPKGDWETKYRGLDKNSLTASDMVQFTKTMLPMSNEWPLLAGKTTRFIAYPNALFRELHQNRGSMKQHLGVWEIRDHEINCRNAGKRSHEFGACEACADGATAYEKAHDTIIRRSYALNDIRTGPFSSVPFSQQHDIPWLSPELAEWRDIAEEFAGQLSDGDMFASAEIFS